MIFHEIDMVGKIWVEEVTSLPVWSASDERRLVYYNDNYYVGSSSGWETLTTGGNGAYISASGSDLHAGTIRPETDNTYDLGSANKRYSSVYAVSFEGITTTATYADLAEKYTMDKEYPVGTLMTITENEEFEMASTDETWDIVTGVISDKPGFLLNADCIGQPVALVGKTPVRVVGSVIKGGFLMNDGNGCAKMTSGTTDMMAIALETNMDEEEKLVMCLLKL